MGGSPRNPKGGGQPLQCARCTGRQSVNDARVGRTVRFRRRIPVFILEETRPMVKVRILVGVCVAMLLAGGWVLGQDEKKAKGMLPPNFAKLGLSEEQKE